MIHHCSMAETAVWLVLWLARCLLETPRPHKRDETPPLILLHLPVVVYTVYLIDVLISSVKRRSCLGSKV